MPFSVSDDGALIRLLRKRRAPLQGASVPVGTEWGLRP